MAQRPRFDQHRPHPWHGLSAGKAPPRLLQAYIEITPFDLVKYEIDKETGYLRVDRPQRTSSLPPLPYGFVPRTYCGARVGRLAGVEQGDHDPLDICVVSERPINRAEVLLSVRVIGGICTLDHGAADDKIVGVLEQDEMYRDIHDLGDLPRPLVDRLSHYFATYKLTANDSRPVEVGEAYGEERARGVVEAALADYQDMAAGRG